jgi:hypothetical protein
MVVHDIVTNAHAVTFGCDGITLEGDLYLPLDYTPGTAVQELSLPDHGRR